MHAGWLGGVGRWWAKIWPKRVLQQSDAVAADVVRVAKSSKATTQNWTRAEAPSATDAADAECMSSTDAEPMCGADSSSEECLDGLQGGVMAGRRLCK